MPHFKLLNYADAAGSPRAGILVGGNTVIDLRDALPNAAWSASTLAVLNAWDDALPALHTLAALGETSEGVTLSSLLAPYDRYAASGEINTEVSDTQAVIDGIAGVAIKLRAFEPEAFGQLQHGRL